MSDEPTANRRRLGARRRDLHHGSRTRRVRGDRMTRDISARWPGALRAVSIGEPTHPVSDGGHDE